MRGVAIDGVTGAGKSIIFRGLQQRLVRLRPSNTKILLSEHYTERMLEHLKGKGTLTEARVLSHINSLLDPLGLLAGQKAGSKFAERAGNTDVLVVMERFLLGHIANMRMACATSWPNESLRAVNVAKRARLLGLIPVVLVVSDSSLPGRVQSTRSRRNPAWSEYLDSIGDDEAVVDHYRSWQAHLLDAAKRVPGLEPIMIDVSESNSPDQLDRVAAELFDRFFADEL